MRSWIRCGVLWLMGALASSAVGASPILLYQFTTTRYAAHCSPGCSPVGSADYRPSLNQMRIGLEPRALAQGTAHLSISQPFASPVTLVNDSVSSAALARYPAEPAGMALDESGYPVNDTHPPFELDMTLSVGSVLTGLIYLNDGSSELALGMSPEALVWFQDPSALFSPVSATEWTGFVRSDALGTGLLFFTGEWHFVRVVPEPGTWVLLLLACAVMVLVRAAQGQNKKGSQTAATPCGVCR